MTLSRLRFTVLSFLATLLCLGAGVMMVYHSLDIFASGGYSHRGKFFTADRYPLSFWAHVALGWVSGVVAIAATPLVAWRAWKATAQEQREIEGMSPNIYGPTRRWLIVTLVILLTPFLLFAFSAKAVILPPAEYGRPVPPLDLRLPPTAVRDVTPASQVPTPTPVAGASPAMRLRPVGTLFEWGIEGSREALIACRKGAYPGAAVAAYQTWTPKSNAQPDHCDRF